jgi:hypothetical protein
LLAPLLHPEVDTGWGAGLQPNLINLPGLAGFEAFMGGTVA